jgi:hypothetical protein
MILNYIKVKRKKLNLNKNRTANSYYNGFGQLA